ncbi:MAG: hypothetical protein ACJA1Z_004072 [Patiriisocius sp.]
MAEIHIPTAINIVKGNLSQISDVAWSNFIRVGIDPTKTVVSTGAEMFIIDETFYLAGGHNFGDSAANNGQKYLDAVYAFTVADKGDFSLELTVKDSISDVPNPKADSSDSTSIFRRRDGPAVPALFLNQKNELEQGLTFYGGIFKYNRKGQPLAAWNDAIYVHPSWNNSGKKYTYDSAYNQKNHNLYACGDFVAYDSQSDKLHTFLYGGIGTGTPAGPERLSGFTNNGMHITFDIASMSSSNVVLDNIYNSDTTKIYGAEATLILNDQLKLFTTSKGQTTEIVDLANAFGNDSIINIGYIYGGIEAFSLNLGDYGPTNSAASNKIWSVSLKRVAE